MAGPGVWAVTNTTLAQQQTRTITQFKPRKIVFEENRVMWCALKLRGLLNAKPAFLFCATVSCVLFYGQSAWSDDGTITIGLRKQLLVDDYVIAEKSGVTRVMGTVTKEHD